MDDRLASGTSEVAKMNKRELLDNIHTERARWEEVLSEVGEERLAQPGPAGEWSIKDIIAHITWHEREMVGVMKARALVGSELWGRPLDERNGIIFEQNRFRPLDDVLAESRQVYQQLLEEVESLSDEALTDASRFAEMPSDWLPWKLLADNTYEHYRDHADSLRARIVRDA
jgi:uncharacterized protein (TIGR03083 family)